MTWLKGHTFVKYVATPQQQTQPNIWIKNVRCQSVSLMAHIQIISSPFVWGTGYFGNPSCECWRRFHQCHRRLGSDSLVLLFLLAPSDLQQTLLWFLVPVATKLVDIHWAIIVNSTKSLNKQEHIHNCNLLIHPFHPAYPDQVHLNKYVHKDYIFILIERIGKRYTKKICCLFLLVFIFLKCICLTKNNILQV